MALRWFRFSGMDQGPMNGVETAFALYGAKIVAGNVLARASVTSTPMVLIWIGA